MSENGIGTPWAHLISYVIATSVIVDEGVNTLDLRLIHLLPPDYQRK